MSNNEVTKFLDNHGACADGRQFAERFDTLADLYDGIERGDWVVWVLDKAGELDKSTAVKLARCFAERVLPIYEAKYNRTEPRKAIEAALVWLENQTEANRVAAANAATYAARAANAALADAAAKCAAYAAYAAAICAACGAYGVYAAYVAADAARAAAVAAATVDVAAYAANAASERKAQVDIVRKIVPNPWRSK